MKPRIIAAATLLLALAGPARLGAIELSLEENKAERGNIGFVDTQRLFKLFPETLKAKENFEEAVRQAEDQINLRKAEVLRLRKEIDELKVERASLAKSTPTATAAPAVQPVTVSTRAAALPAAPVVSTRTAVPPPTAVLASTAAVPALPAPVTAVSTRTTTVPQAAVAAATATVTTPRVSSGTVATYEQLLKPAVSTHTALAQLPGFAVRPAVSTAATSGSELSRQASGSALPVGAASQPLVINLPGATTGPVVIAPPTGTPAPPVAAPAAPAPPAPALTAAAAPPVPPPAAAPVVSTAAAQAALDSALAALDAKLAQKTVELARKETQARDEQETAEKNLLDLESRRSEILLGKLYKAVQEVARREGVSVVVDKTGILYGHNAVDLTEKVLKYLKGS